MTLLREWQGYRGISDERVADALQVTRQTWVRWRDGKGTAPHNKIVAAVNLLRIPKEPATRILMDGYKEMK